MEFKQQVFLATVLGLVLSCLSAKSASIKQNGLFFDDGEFDDFYQPSLRLPRDVSGGVQKGNPGGVQGTVGASGNLYNKNGHSVDGHAQASRNWHPNGPLNVGGGLDYQGPRGGASVNANHVRHFGTDVGVSGNANLWKSRDGRSSLDGSANYNRHFGGPGGTGRPNYGGAINFKHRF